MALNPNINRFYGKDARVASVERDRELGGLFGKWNSVVDDSIKSARAADLSAEKAKELYFKADDIAGDGGLSLKEALKFVDLVIDEFAASAKKDGAQAPQSKTPAAPPLDAKAGAAAAQIDDKKVANSGDVPDLVKASDIPASSPEKMQSAMRAQMQSAPRIEELLSAYGMGQPKASASASSAASFAVASSGGGSVGGSQGGAGAFAVDQGAGLKASSAYTDFAHSAPTYAVTDAETSNAMNQDAAQGDLSLDDTQLAQNDYVVQETNSEQEAVQETPSELQKFAESLDAGGGLFDLVA